MHLQNAMIAPARPCNMPATMLIPKFRQTFSRWLIDLNKRHDLGLTDFDPAFAPKA
jgi:hypothetical protein